MLYNAFGVAAASSTSNQAALTANPFGFTGQINDPVIASDQDLRARDYNPATGRFTGRDPISLRVRDPYVAAYAYANESPTILIDPSGLCTQDTSGSDPIKEGMWTIRHNRARDMVADYERLKYSATATVTDQNEGRSKTLVWTELFVPYATGRDDRADVALLRPFHDESQPQLTKELMIWEVKHVGSASVSDEGLERVVGVESDGPAQLDGYINDFREAFPHLRVA